MGAAWVRPLDTMLKNTMCPTFDPSFPVFNSTHPKNDLVAWQSASNGHGVVTCLSDAITFVIERVDPSCYQAAAFQAHDPVSIF